MILLSLASKQIWPQVLAVAHLKPDRVFLLHSEDAAESRGPAQRLKRFFDDSGLVAKGGTQLESIPHDDFSAIERRFDEIVAGHQLNLSKCVVNFTGGNKLMATAEHVITTLSEAVKKPKGNGDWLPPARGFLSQN